MSINFTLNTFQMLYLRQKNPACVARERDFNSCDRKMHGVQSCDVSDGLEFSFSKSYLFDVFADTAGKMLRVTQQHPAGRERPVVSVASLEFSLS